ncbi:hypothetical protein JCM8208_005831 [Rhodotorula glutinis]
MSPQVDRPAHIQTLISSVDRYNPGNCHLLEDYLQQQLSTGTYDLHANLALLKLYQFNPAILSPSASLSALFLALSNAPFAPDFTLSLALLSDSFAVGAALPPLPAPHPDSDDSDDDDDDAPAPANGGPREPKGEYECVQRLKTLSALLAARKFRAFWALVSSPPAEAAQGEGEGEAKVAEVNALMDGLKESAHGWAERVRKEIAGEVERCFRSLKREQLAAFLGTDDVAATIEAQGWKLDGAEVRIPQNESNAPKAQVTHERIEIEQLARLLGRSQA